jgi:transcriptional regulator with XRE-family HTH domain
MNGVDLAAARHRLGLSVTELAERLRLNMPNGRTFVREMETGKREISGPISVAIELMLKEEDFNGR